MALRCPSCSAEWPESLRYCGACGTELADTVVNGAGSRRVVTALFCDVVGSTSRGESADPERVDALMDRYFATARDVIERHGGTVEKYVGDAVMAVFGWPTQFEDDALRAVQAAVEIHVRLAAEFAAPEAFEARVGLGTGEVLAKERGAGGTFATGDAVNRAARLEQAAGPSETLIDGVTYRLVRHAITAEPLGQQYVRGRSAGLTVFRVLGIDPLAEAVPRDLASPLLGRERELALIRETFDRVRADRRPSVITILAEPGTGKSRLAHEALATMREAAIVMRGRCAASGGAALAPFGDALRDAAGLGTFAEGPDARSRLIELVTGAEDHELLGSRLAAIAGFDPLRIPPEETVWVARRSLEWLARLRPVVVVLDDLQWAQPSLLDLIESVVERLTDVAVLVIAIARPEFLDTRPEWFEGRDHAHRLRLDALPAGASATLLDRLAPALSHDPAARSRVLEVAEGNPLFIEQFVAAFLDAESSDVDGRTSEMPPVSVTPGAISVPSTINALLGARLDNLSSRQRGVVQRASVAGKRFWWGAVAHLSQDADRVHLGSSLSDLVRREFILADPSEFPGDEAFRFKHLLIRDAAYDAIPKVMRAELHERFAAWLENHVGASDENGKDVVAFHLEQALHYRADLGVIGEDDPVIARRASSLYASSGLAAFDRNDMTEAVRLLGRATALLPPDDITRIGLEFRLAKALQQRGEHVDALALVDDALARADRTGNAVLARRGRLWRNDVLQTPGVGEEAEETEAALREDIQCFADAADDEGSILARQHLAYLWLDRAQLGRAMEAAQESLPIARRARDGWLEMRSLALLAVVYLDGPTPISKAIPLCSDLLTSLASDRRLQINILRAQATLLASAARFDEADRLWTDVESITRELDVPWETVLMTVIGALIALLAGRYETAEAGVRAAANLIHGARNRASLDGILARILLAQGRDDEALEIVRRVKALVSDREDVVLSMLVEADIVARRGDRNLAETLNDDAVRQLKGSDALRFLAEALTRAGQVRIHLGDVGEAKALLQRAIDAADSKGELVWRLRASELQATIA